MTTSPRAGVPIRVLFMGTPAFAARILRALVDAPDVFRVVGAVTNPDQAVGRNSTPVASPVKQLAVSQGIPVFQPKKLRDPALADELRALGADVSVVASYGRILPSSLLRLTPAGCVNVHASLLPALRGSSPIQSAVLAGHEQTGITLMRMDEGMDTGDIIVQRAIPLTPRETYLMLHDKLAELGAELIQEFLPSWVAGDLSVQPQETSRATTTALLKKSDGQIDWCRSATEIDRQIRAFIAWPQSFTFTPQGKRLVICDVEGIRDFAKDSSSHRAAGTMDFSAGSPVHELVIWCGDGKALAVRQIQPEGKRPMSAQEFMRGYRQLDQAVLK